jgi:branched-chain amino acid transport system substrate-binding protein
MCPACGTSELDRAGGDFIWRITGSDSDGGLIAAQFARDEGYERVAMLVDRVIGSREQTVEAVTARISR